MPGYDSLPALACGNSLFVLFFSSRPSVQSFVLLRKPKFNFGRPAVRAIRLSFQYGYSGRDMMFRSKRAELGNGPGIRLSQWNVVVFV